MKELKGFKYELVNTKNKGAYYKITLKGDYNDGDYITETTIAYENSEGLNHTILGAFILDYCYSYEGELKDAPDWIEKYLYLPYSDWDICHTLVSVDIQYYDSDGKAYDVYFPPRTEHLKVIDEAIADLYINSFEKWNLSLKEVFDNQLKYLGFDAELDYDEAISITDEEFEDEVWDYNGILRAIIKKMKQKAGI